MYTSTTFATELKICTVSVGAYFSFSSAFSSFTHCPHWSLSNVATPYACLSGSKPSSFAAASSSADPSIRWGHMKPKPPSAPSLSFMVAAAMAGQAILSDSVQYVGGGLLHASAGQAAPGGHFFGPESPSATVQAKSDLYHQFGFPPDHFGCVEGSAGCSCPAPGVFPVAAPTCWLGAPGTADAGGTVGGVVGILAAPPQHWSKLSARCTSSKDASAGFPSPLRFNCSLGGCGEPGCASCVAVRPRFRKE
mmetsp:Transcript_23967/g.60448  ORF Transcript_23967/g.60448 Transcript_23967/m.60448 type:complete len:250 (-) Transcript_23967:287-1036(-)